MNACQLRSLLVAPHKEESADDDVDLVRLEEEQVVFIVESQIDYIHKLDEPLPLEALEEGQVGHKAEDVWQLLIDEHRVLVVRQNVPRATLRLGQLCVVLCEDASILLRFVPIDYISELVNEEHLILAILLVRNNQHSKNSSADELALEVIKDPLDGQVVFLSLLTQLKHAVAYAAKVPMLDFLLFILLQRFRVAFLEFLASEQTDRDADCFGSKAWLSTL
jgi:hypothetical protein